MQKISNPVVIYYSSKSPMYVRQKKQQIKKQRNYNKYTIDSFTFHFTLSLPYLYLA